MQEVAYLAERSVDAIRSWADAGQLKYFRTPGGHRRFQRLDVVRTFRKKGIPIPPSLSSRVFDRHDGLFLVFAVPDVAYRKRAARVTHPGLSEVWPVSDPLNGIFEAAHLGADIAIIDGTSAANLLQEVLGWYAERGPVPLVLLDELGTTSKNGLEEPFLLHQNIHRVSRSASPQSVVNWVLADETSS